MEQAIELVEENGVLVQDKQQIVELPANVLDHVGGGCIALIL